MNRWRKPWGQGVLCASLPFMGSRAEREHQRADPAYFIKGNSFQDITEADVEAVIGKPDHCPQKI